MHGRCRQLNKLLPLNDSLVYDSSASGHHVFKVLKEYFFLFVNLMNKIDSDIKLNINTFIFSIIDPFTYDESLSFGLLK